MIRVGLWETHTCWFPLSREMISYITLTVKTHKCIYSIWQLSAGEQHFGFFFKDQVTLHLVIQLLVAVRREEGSRGESGCVCISVPFSLCYLVIKILEQIDELNGHFANYL